MGRKGVQLSISLVIAVLAGVMLLAAVSFIALQGQSDIMSSLAFLNPANFIPGYGG